MLPNKHKILLIEPPFYRLFKDSYSLNRYPLSLGYLACEIRDKTQWSVTAYNADFSQKDERIKVSYLSGAGFNHYLSNLKDTSIPLWKEVKSVLVAENPDVVGISAKSQNFASACTVARLAKEINKEVVVVMGGPYPSMVGPEVLKCSDIDITVRGEGERTIVKLLNAIESHEALESLRGIIFRKNGHAVETLSSEYIENLDSLGFPHESAPYVLRDYEKYPIVAFKNIFVSRGCPYNCFFCGSRNIWSQRVRFRSPESIVNEIKGLQQKGLKTVHFDDDIFGISKKHLKNICAALKQNCPDVQWSCELHVNLVDDETISNMKAAGCSAIQLGIESGNNEILRQMRKGFTIEEALKACNIIEKHGIPLYTFFIVGFPQETEETLKDTVAAMRKVKSIEHSFSIFTPYPGTEAFQFCKEHGLVTDDFDPSLFNHQSPKNYFCINMQPQRFRELVSKTERMVDRRIYLNKLKRAFSIHSLKRIRELGIAESIRIGGEILLGRR